MYLFLNTVASFVTVRGTLDYNMSVDNALVQFKADISIDRFVNYNVNDKWY